MKIPVNLASDPFRRDRPVLVASAACALALTALACVLAFLVLGERERARETRLAVDRLDTEVRTISAEQTRLEGTLRQPANAEVLERSLLLNTLIDRKSISWTRIFADLEAIKPYNAKVIQVRLPQINSRNEVTLDMIIGSQEPGAAIEFLKRLEASPLFGPATLHASQPPTQNEPLYRYRVSVDYAQKL
jgi:hypothetical protein